MSMIPNPTLRRLVTLAGLHAALLSGCSRQESAETGTARAKLDAGADQPTTLTADETAAAAVQPAAPLIPEWTRAEAAARLLEESDRLLAAVRLVQLASAAAPWEEPLDAAQFNRLRVVPAAAPGAWFFGAMLQEAPLALQRVVAIDQGGVPTPLAEPQTQAAPTTLWWSDATEVFPHLLISPTTVDLVGEKTERAITVNTLGGARLVVRREPFRALALVVEPDELVARYDWDFYEGMFRGPAEDNLPSPPGGSFQLDTAASPRLIPVGGRTPATQENTVPPTPRKVQPPPPF